MSQNLLTFQLFCHKGEDCQLTHMQIFKYKHPLIDFFSVKRFSANQFNAKQEDIQTFQLIYVFPMFCGGLTEGKPPRTGSMCTSPREGQEEHSSVTSAVLQELLNMDFSWKEIQLTLAQFYRTPPSTAALSSCCPAAAPSP